MASSHWSNELTDEIRQFMSTSRVNDPYVAVRNRARELMKEFAGYFGECPPFDLETVASYLGIAFSDDAPLFSEDAELATEDNGTLVIRVNREKPKTRQRFSIAHEIGHTFFPGYRLAVRCRGGNRQGVGESNLLESLCDAAAAELLFPDPWFSNALNGIEVSSRAVLELAASFDASRDATVRRVVECSKQALAAVFLRWKLKPSELRSQRQARGLCGAKKLLRVDYAILNTRFAAEVTSHVPRDKSVGINGLIYDCSKNRTALDGTEALDLGTYSGVFSVTALPRFTHVNDVGPLGEASVVAILKK